MVWSFSSEGPKAILTIAKRMRIDPNKIRRDLAAADKAKQKPAATMAKGKK